jgi:ferredoxin-NADP reductase
LSRLLLWTSKHLAATGSVCGPDPMMDAEEAALIGLGVPP